MSAFRDLGNEKFREGSYKEAEQLYTEAILSHSRSDPKVFQNRALTRLRLNDNPGAESDARKAIELHGPKTSISMKAHYYLAQALLAQRHVSEALDEAQLAYRMCLENKDSSSDLLSQFILRTKQAKWAAKETARLREMNQTLAMVEDLLDRRLDDDLSELNERFRNAEIGETGRDEERSGLEKEAEERRKAIRDAFRDPEKPETEERASGDRFNLLNSINIIQVVPDYLIDSITFEIMHDPVITPSGASYERVGLLRHLKATGLDPLTREPLSEKQLYPNVALRNACSTFLEDNGWAVDY